VTVATAIAVEPVPACSDTAPCGPDWLGMTQMGLALGLLYWYARLPELTVVTAPVLAVVVAWVEFPAPGAASLAMNRAVIAALAFGWAAALARLAARHRQRRLVERAAGVQHRLPEPVGPPLRGTIPIAAGLLLCALAVGAIVLGLRTVHADGQQAARAVRTAAEVTGRDDVSLRVRTEDGRRMTVDATYPEDYAPGTTVTVLENGPWRRLAAEPYAPFGHQLLALAVGLPGLSLLTTGILARLRSTALRRGPVTALRVLERLGDDGRTWVYAADDVAGRTPLFACLCVPEFLQRDEPEESGKGGGAAHDGDEDFPTDGMGPREAVMFGAPCEGAEMVFLTPLADGDPVTLRTAGPVRLPGVDPRFRPR
jgi:hypothetical protein